MDSSPSPKQKLSYSERKEQRFAQRVEKWEDRLAGPPPPKYWHRAVATIVMMVMMLGLLYVMIFGHAGGAA